MIALSDSDEPVKAALHECLQARAKRRVRTAFLWVHVIGNHGQVHFYPTERTNIQSPPDEMLGDTIWHIADVPGWDDEEMEFTLQDGTVRYAEDAEERQRILAAHVEAVVRTALAELLSEIQPDRVAVHSEWGEFASEWNNKAV